MKINKTLTKIFTLSLMTVSIIYASRLMQLNNTLPQKTYHEMDLTELQKEVELRSQNGDLPFEMGLELIKRWSTES